MSGILSDPGIQSVEMGGEVVWTKPDANGWQPIETAPKDGTIFLGVQIESFIGENLIRAPMYWSNGDWHLAWTYWIDGESQCEPTHWMPLPDPPA